MPARQRHFSVNKLMEVLPTQPLAEFDTAVRFRILTANGNLVRGLALLVKLDAVLPDAPR